MPSKNTISVRDFIACTYIAIVCLTFITYEMTRNSYMYMVSSHDSFNDIYEIKRRLKNDRLSPKQVSYRIDPPVFKTFYGEKLVHLDLKGAPPLLTYLQEFLPFIKSLGATGILLEYEDMFPYSRELRNIRSLKSYKPAEISEINNIVNVHRLKLIPLIQTFSHLEFILKLREYRNLRELDNYSQQLCPSNSNVFPIIFNMINQILDNHPEASYIHLGCDEVYYLGHCDRCKEAMEKNDWNPKHIFFNYVKILTEYIRTNFPKVRPIVWGDMFTQENEGPIVSFNMSGAVDVMIWVYKKDVTKYITEDLLNFFSLRFKSVWVASSFKGTTGPGQIVTDIRHHLTNHMSWMDIIHQWENRILFKGIAITGWQRYDHFSVLCELLPVGIPSLTYSLQYLNGSRIVYQPAALRDLLSCDFFIPLSPIDITYRKISNCNFPGFNVYRIVNQFYAFASNAAAELTGNLSGWFTIYHLIHRFTNRYELEEIFQSYNVTKFRNDLKHILIDLKVAFSEVYDDITIEEWILTNVAPFERRIEALYNIRLEMAKSLVWPRRPLPPENHERMRRVIDDYCWTRVYLNDFLN